MIRILKKGLINLKATGNGDTVSDSIFYNLSFKLILEKCTLQC